MAEESINDDIWTSGRTRGICRIRTNKGLRELYKDLDVGGIKTEKIGMVRASTKYGL
jgi:hypothetical protein